MNSSEAITLFERPSIILCATCSSRFDKQSMGITLFRAVMPFASICMRSAAVINTAGSLISCVFIDLKLSSWLFQILPLLIYLLRVYLMLRFLLLQWEGIDVSCRFPDDKPCLPWQLIEADVPQ